MKFTKGNTIVTFGKLWHLQKKFAQRYAEQGGKEFDSLVDRIYIHAARYTKDEQMSAWIASGAEVMLTYVQESSSCKNAT